MTYAPGITDTASVTLYGEMPEAAFTLPQSLTEIRDEAFVGGAMHTALLPEGVVSIGARAFADCVSLTNIYIPAGTTKIDGTAFEGCVGLIIWGYPGSAAEQIAQSHGSGFVNADMAGE